jgi:hypothetical protein
VTPVRRVEKKENKKNAFKMKKKGERRVRAACGGHKLIGISKLIF